MRVLIDTKIKVDGTEHPIKVYSVRPRWGAAAPLLAPLIISAQKWPSVL